MFRSASAQHAALKRELSLQLEFGLIPGNLCDLSKGYFATTFLSSNPTTSATQSSPWGLVRQDFALDLAGPSRLRGNGSISRTVSVIVVQQLAAILFAG